MIIIQIMITMIIVMIMILIIMIVLLTINDIPHAGRQAREGQHHGLRLHRVQGPAPALVRGFLLRHKGVSHHILRRRYVSNVA